LDIIEQAIEFATTAHDGQYRKATKIPYITHPMTVGMILLKNGYSEQIIAAGILHDTVEDTDITLDQIRENFGEHIADIVRGATEENKQLSWEERKEATLRHIAKESKDVCLVVCADKLHNLRSIRKSIEVIGEKAWQRFNRGRDKQEWYYRGIVKELKNQLQDEKIYKELSDEVEKVFKLSI
jgi:(p)ppGpp synthase/HD superfamily hydrolase